MIHISFLEAIRNLLIHKHGVCDKRFLLKIKKIKTPELAHLHNLKSGEKLQVDGTIVGVIVTSTIKASLRLIHFVDDYVFASRPQPQELEYYI